VSAFCHMKVNDIVMCKHATNLPSSDVEACIRCEKKDKTKCPWLCTELSAVEARIAVYALPCGAVGRHWAFPRSYSYELVDRGHVK
jgi:hypothetical protein